MYRRVKLKSKQGGIKMRSETINTYRFDELGYDVQEKVVARMRDINTDDDWWIFIYEDAENVGIKILGFDDYKCTCEFFSSGLSVAEKIIKQHGENTGTHLAACEFIYEYNKLLAVGCDDDGGDYAGMLDDLCNEFLYKIAEEYRIMLNKEREYLQRDECIIETIIANEREFDAEGNLWY